VIPLTWRASAHTSLRVLLALAWLATACSKGTPEPEPTEHKALAPIEDVDSDAAIEDVSSLPPLHSLTPEQQLIALATERVPWVDLGELGTSLYDARLHLHVVQGGPVYDLGEANALKLIQGRWRAPWLDPIRITEAEAEEAKLPRLANRRVVWNEGASASVRFPLADDLPTDKNYTLVIRLRPKMNQFMEVRLNSFGAIETVPLQQGWQTVKLTISPKKLNFGGENTLSFVFAGSFFEGTQRVAARFDTLRLLPEGEVERWQDEPPPGDLAVPEARILTTEHRSLGLPSPLRLDGYYVLPDHPRLRVFIGPAPYTQMPVPLTISVRSDLLERRVLFNGSIEPGAPWKPFEADLTDFAGQAVQLSFEVLEGEQGATGERPAVYLGEPAIVELRPDAPAAPTPAGDPPRPERVVIIGIDALRADRVAPAGTLTHAATPNLSRLANEGARLDALAQGAGTIVPTSSLLTGTYGDKHGVFDTATYLRTSLVTLGELFDGAGWLTSLLSTDPYITLARGYAQGFDGYRNLVEEDGPARTSRLMDVAVRVLKKASTRPQMLFMQIGGLRLPHQPDAASLVQFYSGAYAGPITVETLLNPAVLTLPLAPEDERYLNALYDAELFEIDGYVGELVRVLEETGGLDNTLLIIVGVHGEPLGEDPMLGYGNRLSNAELRVPVIVRFPPRFKPGTRPRQTIELVDLLPTVADIVGLELPEGVQGASVVKLLEGRRDNSADAVFAAAGDTHRAVAQGRYHYLLRTGDNDLLFDTLQPGREGTKDLSQTLPIARRALRDTLAIFLGYASIWEKPKFGSPSSPRSALADYAIERGW